MQVVLPKWVTKLSVLVLGVLGVFELLEKVVDVSTLPSPWNLYLAIVMGIVAGIGRALGDDDQDGVPNLIDPDYRRRGAASIAVILALASLGLLLVACGPAISGARPGVALSVVADSVGGQYDCNGNAPDVACFVTISDSASGAVIVDNARINLGQVVQLPTRPCLAVGRVAYTGRFTGVTATGRLGPVHVVTGGAMCDLAGNGVRGTIILQFRPAGS